MFLLQSRSLLALFDSVVRDTYDAKTTCAIANFQEVGKLSKAKWFVFLLLATVLLSTVGLVHSASASLEVMGSWYRADRAFPEYIPFWFEGYADIDPDVPHYAYEGMPLGGSVHVFLRNSGQETIRVDDILFEGTSLTQAIAFGEGLKKRRDHAANIVFSDLPSEEKERLISLGDPIWWKVEPREIPPGNTAEAILRLRRHPKDAGATIGLTLDTTDIVEEITIPKKMDNPRVESIGFSPALDRLYFFLWNPNGALEPISLILDGEEFEGDVNYVSDERCSIVPGILKLDTPWARGSFHTLQAKYADGSCAWAGFRVWEDELAYGIWGAMGGEESDVELARNYVRDIYKHNMNAQMTGMGSAAVVSFVKSDDGQKMLKSLGIRVMVGDPGAHNVKEPYAYFIRDEPDGFDFHIGDALDINRRLGSLCQSLVEVQERIREKDPLTPNLTNIDSTFKPDNYYVYGQMSDIFATDPYYQPRLAGAFSRHPERLPLLLKPTIIYAQSDVSRSACAPRPLHLVLYSVSHHHRQSGEQLFRFPTPKEKRVEVYYSLAAGAKGFSFWWYSPDPVFDGCGSSKPGAAELWREIGLLGAEMRTIGPLVLRSCPALLPIEKPDNLWVKTLLSGQDTLLVVCVNERHANDRLGTSYVPLKNVEMSIDTPGWITPKDAFEITYNGVKDAEWKTTDEGVEFQLGYVHMTRLLVITADESIRAQLQAYYHNKLRANVDTLTSG